MLVTILILFNDSSKSLTYPIVFWKVPEILLTNPDDNDHLIVFNNDFPILSIKDEVSFNFTFVVIDAAAILVKAFCPSAPIAEKLVAILSIPILFKEVFTFSIFKIPVVGSNALSKASWTSLNTGLNFITSLLAWFISTVGCIFIKSEGVIVFNSFKAFLTVFTPDKSEVVLRFILKSTLFEVAIYYVLLFSQNKK